MIIIKEIPFSNGLYSVDDEGSVYSHHFNRTKILKQNENKHGYLQVSLHINKIAKVYRVHSLITLVFLGERQKGYVVNHKDGNKKNNKLSNLEYVTSAENNIHALKTGLRHPAKMKGKVPKGTLHYNATITEDDVYEIIRIHNSLGYGCRRIAKLLNLTVGVVDGILRGRNWCHITGFNKKE